ncbi:MAG: HNH endonuclease signature motif containing protein, partial [Leptospirales bacterium]
LLRNKMGAELGNFNPVNIQNFLTQVEIEQLARTGIEIPPDQVQILSDGTLAYKNSRVIIYIRDVSQYSNKEPTLPKYHVSDCKTLQTMRERNRYERYVVSTREDGFFILNLNYKSTEKRLEVCKHCLEKLEWEGYQSSQPQSRRNSIVSSFTIHGFFLVYDKNLIFIEPKYTDQTAPENKYSEDFGKISERIKEQKRYCCEVCHKILSMAQYRKFLHVHHINGQKWDNDPKNLKVICLYCHANEFQHNHMKNNPEYYEFLKIMNELPSC